MARHMKLVEASIVSNSELMPGVFLLQLRAPEIAAVAQPGQFVMISCGPDTVLRRPFSIHYTQNSEYITVLFAALSLLHDIRSLSCQLTLEEAAREGIGTLWLSQRTPGETVDVLGPLGNGYNVTPKSKNILMVAGGIGIAPLLFLAQNSINQGKQVTLLIGARSDKQLYPTSLLPTKSRNIIVTEDGSAGRRGMVSEIVTDFVRQSDQVFACGPRLMYRAILSMMKEQSIEKPVQVSLETRMGCGVGACYGCSINTAKGMKMVCRDGPVFDVKDVIWEELKL